MVFALALPEAFRAVHLTPEAHRALFRRVARSNLVAVFVPSSCRAREPDLTAAFRDALVTACQEHSDEAPIEKGRWRTLTHCIQSRVSLSPLKGGSLLSAPICTSWLVPLKVLPWVVIAGLLVIVGQSAPPAQAAVALFIAYTAVELFKEYKE